MSIKTISQQTNNQLADAESYLDNKSIGILRPKSTSGISGFVFDIPLRENIELSADVSEHYTESGSFINDHVVLKPVRIMLQGLIGELAALTGIGTNELSELNNRLETVEAYLGDFTPGMVQILQNAITDTDQALNALNEQIKRAENIIGLFEGESPDQTRQQQYFQQIEALWKAKTLVTVQTPWKYYDSMIIDGISMIQNEDTDEITDISVTMREMRFAELVFTNFKNTLFPVREEMQSSEEQEGGTVKGVRNSFAFDAVQALGGGE